MSLFTESSNDVDPSKQESQSQAPNPVDQLLQGIKNENGEQKYNSVEEALKGASHAQEFIATLKKEKEQLEAMVKSQEQLSELLAKQPEPKQEQTPIEPAAAVAGVSQEDVLKLLEQREQEKVANANLDRVEASLREAFGATYQESLSAKTAELGLTQELVDSMAKNSPDALLKLFDVKGKPVKPNLGNGINTEQFNEKPVEKRKFNPFQRKESSTVSKWKASAERTNARLGL